MYPPFTPGLTATVTASNSSARVAVSGPQVEINNEGSVTVYVAVGDSTVTAAVPTGTPAVNCYPVLGGQCKVISKPTESTHLAYITSSGSSVFYVTGGAGE